MRVTTSPLSLRFALSRSHSHTTSGKSHDHDHDPSTNANRRSRAPPPLVASRALIDCDTIKRACCDTINAQRRSERVCVWRPTDFPRRDRTAPRELVDAGLVHCRGVVANMQPQFERARLLRGTLDALGMHEVQFAMCNV